MKTTKDCILEICAVNRNITHITIAQFGKQKNINSELTDWSRKEQENFDFALDMRSKYNLPFWNGIMLASVAGNTSSTECIMAAMRHNINCITTVSPEDLSKISVSDNIGINSRVILADGSEKHIPMLDFHIRYSEQNTPIVSQICSIIDPNGGYILNSGHSYHYIGKVPVSTDELIDMLAKAQFFAPITDSIWIAHQILERACTLRLGIKHGIVPYVVNKIMKID